MRYKLILSIVVLLLAVSLVSGATTAWFSDQAVIDPNIFTVTVSSQKDSAWGDGTVYHATNHRYFEFTKSQLLETGGRQADLVQGPDGNKKVLGKVTVWIETVSGVQTLCVKFDTTGYGLIEKTDVYAGLPSAGNPPNSPGKYGSHRTYYGNTVTISLHHDITRINDGGAGVSISQLGGSTLIRIAAHADVYH
jgi:predicted ribosomally synthesized peptide with SipW-like signal peptide